MFRRIAAAGGSFAVLTVLGACGFSEGPDPCGEQGNVDGSTSGPNCPSLAEPAPTADPLRAVPASYTNSHLVTIDGLGYDFQAVGEFVLARSELPGLEVQSRQVQYGGPDSPVSVNAGFAFDIDGDEVSVTRSPAGVLAIHVNGEARTAPGQIDLPEGGQMTSDSSTVRVSWPDGSSAVITDHSTFLDLSLALSDRHAGRVSGLLGNFDGDTRNDLATSEGKDLTTTPDADELYGAFAQGWRTTDDTSLFEYLEGETTETFTDRLIPSRIVSVDDLDEGLEDSATATCTAAGITNEVLLANCIRDVAVSGDTEFAVALTEVQEGLETEIEVASVQGDIEVPTILCDGRLAVPELNADFTGTFTNPDVALVWNMELKLGQCDADVTGSFSIVADKHFQRRRMAGTLNQDQILVQAGFPVAHDGRYPCTNMQITLVASGDGLAGSWTSSSCPQGGEVNLTRTASSRHRP